MMEARLVFVALERCIGIKGYARRSIMKVKHLRERNACTFLASISVVIRQQRTVLPHNDNVYSQVKVHSHHLSLTKALHRQGRAPRT